MVMDCGAGAGVFCGVTVRRGAERRGKDSLWKEVSGGILAKKNGYRFRRFCGDEEQEFVRERADGRDGCRACREDGVTDDMYIGLGKLGVSVTCSVLGSGAVWWWLTKESGRAAPKCGVDHCSICVRPLKV